MEPQNDALSLASLETVNRVARATHLWIRHRQATRPYRRATTAGQAEQDMAAGVISGLCDALLLDGQYALLSAYAYALLDGAHEDALLTARALMDQKRSTAQAVAFQNGKMAAIEIIGVVQFAAPAASPSSAQSPEAACGRSAHRIGTD